VRKEPIEYPQADALTVQATPEIPPWVYGNPQQGRNSHYAEGQGYPLKRLFDIVVVLAGLIISSPLWLVFALAIKLEDRGPVFFTQERWGKNKSKIRVYKFRTMLPNAVEKFGNIQAREHDPRVTRIGHFLRSTSLDEMPQLLNILRGDMSWVGPRALPIDEIQAQREGADLPDEAIPGFEARARLRPGLTGITQIFAPRDIPRQQKYQYDAIYAGSQSLWLDLRLIFLSLWITLRARWEARGNKL
jgi:lipopolysaccharide/colanic/teichoic acid biosynthesis glycosyltransferase